MSGDEPGSPLGECVTTTAERARPTGSAPQSPVGSGPCVAIVANAPSPYRLHQHRRFATEIPGIRLHSLFTHEYNNQPWKFDFDPVINAEVFGPGEAATERNKPSAQLREWRRAGRVIRRLREIDPDVVIVTGWGDALRHRVFAWLRRNRVPHFVFGDSNIHGDFARGLVRTAKSMILRHAIRNATGVVCVSEFGRRYFARYGATPDRTVMIPQEPDYALIESITRDEVESAGRELGLDPGRRRIVFSGRLVRNKRPDLLIDAFLRIAPERPEWDVVFLGNGPLLDELSAKADSAAPGRIRFLGFVDDQRRVTAIYANGHILALPSDHEPWALVVNEAVAVGLAIVASDVVGAAPHLVHEGVNGRVFPHGDLDALTAALREATDPAVNDAMRAASPGVLADWRRNADQVDGLRRCIEMARASRSQSAAR